MRTIFRILIPAITGCVLAAPAIGQIQGRPNGIPESINPSGVMDRKFESLQREREIIRARLSRNPALARADRVELEKLRRVPDEERQPYADLLKAENTGIFKLFPDNGCVKKGLIRVSGECSGFVPDSSSFSFRQGRHWSGGGDLVYFKNNFASQGLFSQSILVPLGNVPVETVGEVSAGVTILLGFEPQLTASGVEAFAKQIEEGVEREGYRFSTVSSPEVGTTYALRKIEYKSSGEDLQYKPIPKYGRKISIKSFLNGRERKDTIYIFRVLGKDADGSLTIVWRQISRKDAPSIVFRKGDKVPKLDSLDGMEQVSDARVLEVLLAR